MGRETEDGEIENVYRLQIMNTAETTHHYKLTVSGIDSIALATANEVTLEATTSRAVPVRVRVEHGKGKVGSNKIMFELQALDDPNLRGSERKIRIFRAELIKRHGRNTRQGDHHAFHHRINRPYQ